MIRRWLHRLRLARPPLAAAAGSPERPIAQIGLFLEDLRARGFAPRGIVDVGANAGHWSRLAHSVFGPVPLLMIEPQAEMEEALSALAKDTPGSHYVRAGAGRSAGEMVQTIWEDRAGSSFLPHVEPQLLQSGRQRRTPIVTLDAVLAERPGFRPDLVKLDIQGFELEALAGGTSLFGRTEVFIAETSLFRFLPNQPVLREIVQFMAERDYELYDITEFLRRPSDGAVGQLDCAFVKARGRFRASDAW